MDDKLKEKIIKTVNKANEIVDYCLKNKDNIVLVDDKDTTLVQYMFNDDKAYPFDEPFNRYIEKYNDIDNLDSINQEYAVKFMSYMDKVLIPRYNDYVKNHKKYKDVYMIQYTSKNRTIETYRYLEQLNNNNKDLLYYQIVDNNNPPKRNANRDLFNEPELVINTKTKELTATMWAYKKEIKRAKTIIILSIERLLVDALDDLKFK